MESCEFCGSELFDKYQANKFSNTGRLIGSHDEARCKNQECSNKDVFENSTGVRYRALIESAVRKK